MAEPVDTAPTAAAPSEGPESSRLRLDDPKKLYRLFDTVLQPDGAGSAPPTLEGCVEEFFKGFRDDLGLQGALLYRERRGTYHRVQRVGLTEGQGPATLEGDSAVLRSILARRTSLLGPEEASQLAPRLAATAALAAVSIPEPHAPHLLLLVLERTTPRHLFDFVLNTLRAVLSARILQTRWHDAMRGAVEIQRGLLPAHPPRMEGFDIAGRSVAAQEVGGDFFDYLVTEPDLLGLAVGDASGHGLPAALVARDVQVGLRMGIEQETKIARVLSRLNRVVRSNLLAASFVSVFYGELEPGGHLVYVSAGHPPPLLVKADRTERLTTKDAVLGPIADLRYARRFAHLEPGDVLVLYTDGIVERIDGEGALFGENRLEAVVRARRCASAEALVDAVFEQTFAFGRRTVWEDDATVVVVRRL